MNELIYVTQEQRDLILNLFGGVRREAPDIAGLGSDEIDADYLSELRTSRNRWRREAKDLRAENARLRSIISESASAIGNGACIGPECSLEFMSYLPKEIAGVLSDLRARAASDPA